MWAEGAGPAWGAVLCSPVLLHSCCCLCWACACSSAHLVGGEVHLCFFSGQVDAHTCQSNLQVTVHSLWRQTHRDCWQSIKCLGILTSDGFLGLEFGQCSGEVVLLCPCYFLVHLAELILLSLSL